MPEAWTEAAIDVVEVTSNSMPAARHKIPISVRVDPEQHAAWTRAAEADDRSLAKWIQRCCDAAAATAGFKPIAAKPRKHRTPRRRQ